MKRNFINPKNTSLLYRYTLNYCKAADGDADAQKRCNIILMSMPKQERCFVQSIKNAPKSVQISKLFTEIRKTSLKEANILLINLNSCGFKTIETR